MIEGEYEQVLSTSEVPYGDVEKNTKCVLTISMILPYISKS